MFAVPTLWKYNPNFQQIAYITVRQIGNVIQRIALIKPALIGPPARTAKFCYMRALRAARLGIACYHPQPLRGWANRRRRHMVPCFVIKQRINISDPFPILVVKRGNPIGGFVQCTAVACGARGALQVLNGGVCVNRGVAEKHVMMRCTCCPRENQRAS